MRWDRATEEQLQEIIQSEKASLIEIQLAYEELERRSYEKICDEQVMEYDNQYRMKYNPFSTGGIKKNG